MPKYDHKKIEAKWKKSWEKSKIYKTNDPGFAKATPDKPKYYVLDMFPYPSGAGLHVGHPKGYIATDIVARMKMMQGYNVLHPMGWDAFGLPAENYALKNKVHPAEATAENIKVFKKQLGLLGFTYDWDREVNTTDPQYYKWTQWIFLQMFKKGLAFESYEPINWCPSCKTGLANEDLEDGKCERCGSVVEQKPMRQWVLKITDYAERLLNDIELLKEWPEPIKEMQRNWIGRSEGMLFSSPVKDTDIVIQTFSAHFEAFCADTFVVIAPDHPLLPKLVAGTPTEKEVLKKADEITKARAVAGYEEKEMDGIFTGRYTVDPVGNGELPIWVASYALANYGTGIVKCSAHDERDFAFAKKFGIKLKEVLEPLITKNTGEDAFREGEAISERNAVVAVIKHWSEDKYLGVEWKRTGWKGFVIGGINSGEDPVAAGLREIIEETGYQHPEFMESLGGTVHARFYQLVKNENRLAHFKPLLFKLKDGERGEIAAEETALHDLKWLTAEEMSNFITHEDMRIVWRRVQGNLCYTDMRNGILNEPATLAGPITSETRGKIIKYLEENKLAVKKVNYKLRDWVFSRQRYWGEPIPLINCEKCGWQPVPENELPLELPKVKHYEPTGTGESPLAGIDKWVNTKCPHCSGPAKRETNTMPQWAGSCWYYLRYCDNQNDEDFFRVNAVHKPAIQTTEKDKLYFNEFKKLYSELESKGIKVWAGNRLLLNGLNHDLWVPLRTVSLVAWEQDVKTISDYLIYCNYILIQDNAGNLMYEQDGVRVEIIPVYNKGGEVYSLTYQNAKQPMKEVDLPINEIGYLWGFSYRVISPVYNLTHYKFVQEHENEDRTGLGDKDKIEFLEEWLKNVNKKLLYWNPVDLYVGGAEHATRHLIYARFWHKFLFDIGAVANVEPFTKLQNVGLILAEDGRKMSKRWNNVINPDDVVAEFGADAMRLYEMFMGPFDQACAWSTKGVIGCRRFLEKVWNMSSSVILTRPVAGKDPLKSAVRDSSATPQNDKIEILLNQTIKKVSEDIQAMRFNTAISQLMIFANEASQFQISDFRFQIFLQLLAPFAPHLCEELWAQLGNKESIFKSAWPKFDSNKIQHSEITVVVQVNGKVRDEVVVPVDISEADVKALALVSEKIQKWLEGKEPKKVIYVRGKLVSIVV